MQFICVLKIYSYFSLYPCALHYIFELNFIECPESFQAIPSELEIPQEHAVLIDYDDGFDTEDCKTRCYELGCSYISFVYESTFHQYSDRLHLIPKKCKLYNETVPLREKITTKGTQKEILCKSTFEGIH